MSSLLYYLSQGQCQTLQAKAHMQLHVISGRLWVTMAHDANDYFVGPGQALELKAGRVTLEADSLQAATFALEAHEKSEVRRYAGFCAQRLPAA